MSKFKIGDKVKISGNKAVGQITAVHDGDIWTMWSTGKPDYTVELENGSGAITVAETALEPLDFLLPVGIGCECGAIYTSFKQHHSVWCPLYEKG